MILILIFAGTAAQVYDVLCLHVSKLYTPNLGLRIDVPGREREQQGNREAIRERERVLQLRPLPAFALDCANIVSHTRDRLWLVILVQCEYLDLKVRG